ncbi:MAG TPA: glycosyltransferase family 2 protein [Acidimicrobiales bacterium]|nr:glycosyltransferase family 2 protein [Acidimicrobiales bacterium]
MAASVIVVSHRRHEWLERSLQSALDDADEVVLVDNGSGGDVAAIGHGAGARVVTLPENLGFPGGVNAGLEVAKGEVLALLNDDAFCDPGWLATSAEVLRDPTVGAVAAKMVFALPFAEVRFADDPHFVGADPRPLGRMIRSVRVRGADGDLLERLVGPGVHRVEHGVIDGAEAGWRWTTGRDAIYVPLPAGAAATDVEINGAPAPVTGEVTIVNSAGTYLSAHGFGGDYGFGAPDDGSLDEPAERFGVCGGALVTRRDVVDRVGPFAADFFAYYEDLDWSWRMRLAGFSARYEPSAVVRHVGGVTTGGPAAAAVKALASRNRLRCLARNAPLRVLPEEIRLTLRDSPPPGLARHLAADLPRALAQRRSLRTAWRLSADEVWRRWAGADERWPGSPPG